MIEWFIALFIIAVIIGVWVHKDEDKKAKRKEGVYMQLGAFGKLGYLASTSGMWLPTNKYEVNEMITKVGMAIYFTIGYVTGWFWIMLLLSVFFIIGHYEWIDESGS